MKPDKPKNEPQRTKRQRAMAYAILYPKRRTTGEVPRGETVYHDLQNEIWRCRAVLRHSPALAERVLDGSITLNEAFREAQPLTRSKPGLPVVKPLQAPADDIKRSELNEFQQIFGWGNVQLMATKKPKPEPQRRQPADTPDDPDDPDSDRPDSAIPKPHELPGFVQPPPAVHAVTGSKAGIVL
jgi:hypothetical protein